MPDSENTNLTDVEKELVKEILTRAWLSMDLLRADGSYEDIDGIFSPLSREQLDALTSAINKI